MFAPWYSDYCFGPLDGWGLCLVSRYSIKIRCFLSQSVICCFCFNVYAVKPETTEKMHLQTGPGAQLELHWDHPVGRVPGHCLEWEVEHNQDGPDGKVASVWIT